MRIIRKETKKRVTKTLYYSQLSTTRGKLVGGGILNSFDHIESELWTDSKYHPKFDSDIEEWVSTDQIQLHIGGTRRAMEELGTILIALARSDILDDQYSMQFDLIDIQENSSLHLILHLPVDDISKKDGFPKVYNFAKAWLDKNGNPLSD